MEKIQYINSDFLAPKDAWDALSLPEKATMMKVAVKNGIYDLSAIRQKYNEFAEGGDTNPYTVGATVDALYGSNPREEYLGEPSHHYDFTQSEEWANTHGYYPDARGHRDDRVKKPTHPSHPSRGTWNGDKFELTDLGMQNPNYTLFGLTDGGQDPQAVLTYQGGIVLPEVTVTPNENYFYNPYDNIILHQKANGGKIYIKPSHRGRLTELKKRTGKTEAELYRTGGPAVRKMITFARNARKWKHGDGGSLSYPEGTITYNQPFYDYDKNGKLILDENGKPTINYNATTSDIVIVPSREPIGLDFLAKGINVNSNPTVGDAAREAGEAAIKEKNRRAAEAVERFNSQNEMHSIFPVDEVSGETVYDYKHEPKVIGLSGVDPMGEFFVAGEALGPLFKIVPPIYNKGIRFAQNVSDRHQGMIDAAEYTANNFIKSKNAMDVTNYIWKNRQGPQASGIIAPYEDKIAFMKKPDGSTAAVATNGGHQTINMHLGGVHYGDKPWELNPMDKTGRYWLREYTETAPQGTIFGEVGTTKNFAEQYNEVAPSWTRAIKDAITNKKEVNNPYWKDYEKNTLARMAGANGEDDLLSYYTHQLDNNNPLSVDSYSMILNMAKRGKYDLRYDSSPMGFFNNLGVREKEFYNNLFELSPEEKVDAINKWITKFNSEARPAYLKDGEVVIPRPLLKKKTPSKNTWLKK